MDHLREVAKIAEWAVKGDGVKVRAYLNQLIEKLTQQGDGKAAERLQVVLKESPPAVQTSGIGTPTRLPVDSESRLSLADEEIINPAEFPVVLGNSTQNRIEEFIEYVGKADELEAHGVGMAPSMITYGPPGTGKTQLAKHIAGRLKMPLITARADTLISSFLGSTSKNIRNLFDHVASRNCVLFLDEIDAFAKQRDDHQELGELKRVVVSLLQNVDAMNPQSVLLAATNHDHLLDPAIWRRFTFKIPLALPGEKQREDLFRLFLGNHAATQDVELLAIIGEGLSGSDVRTFAQDAIRDAVVRKSDCVDERRLVFRLLAIRLKRDCEKEDADADALRAVKAIRPEYFTGKRLAKIFAMTEAKVSRWLRKGGGET